MPLTLRPLTRCCPPASAILAIPFVTSPRCSLYTARMRDEIYYTPTNTRVHKFNCSKGNNDIRFIVTCLTSQADVDCICLVKLVLWGSWRGLRLHQEERKNCTLRNFLMRQRLFKTPVCQIEKTGFCMQQLLGCRCFNDSFLELVYYFMFLNDSIHRC